MTARRTVPLVLDVRSQPNYEAGHAIDAYNIPMDELRGRGFEMPSHATPLVVECDAADVETVREWFATRDERCRWNVVDVRGASAEELGFVPGRFLFSGSPLLAAMEQHVRAVAAAPGSRALDLASGSGRDAALLCCRYGFEFVCALDRDGRALSRWTRLLDRHASASASRACGRGDHSTRAGRPHGARVAPGAVAPHPRCAISEKRNACGDRVAPRAGRPTCSTRSSKTLRPRRTPWRRTSCGARFLRSRSSATTWRPSTTGAELSFLRRRKRIV